MKKIEILIAAAVFMLVTGLVHSETFNKAVCGACSGAGTHTTTYDCGACDSGTKHCTSCQGSQYIDCGQCGGNGTVTVNGEEQTCNLCEGAGNYPCRSCGGSGTESCWYCGGDGEHEQVVTCWACGGDGSVD